MSFVWNEDSITFVKDNAEKLSMRKLAEELGCSKSAVCGKLFRLGLSGSKTKEFIPDPDAPLTVEIEPGKYKETRDLFFRARCASCETYSPELHWGRRGIKVAADHLRRLGPRRSGNAKTAIEFRPRPHARNWLRRSER